MKSFGSFSKRNEPEKGTVEHTPSYTSMRRGRRGSLMESASQFGYYKSSEAEDLPKLPQSPLSNQTATAEKKVAASLASITNSKALNSSNGNTINESLQFSSLDGSSSNVGKSHISNSPSQV